MSKDYASSAIIGFLALALILQFFGGESKHPKRYTYAALASSFIALLVSLFGGDR